MIREYDPLEIPSAPLVVDAVYRSNASSAGGFDSLPALLKCGNQGGFRKVVSPKGELRYVVLFSSLSDPDWPDTIDYYNGMVTYFGDNKRVGDLHDTPLKGNLFLRGCFDALHKGELEKIPPIFFFTKGTSGKDVIFRGLLIPGKTGITSSEDLVAIWKIKKGQRFQNYRAIFTMLDEAIISRQWVEDLQNGVTDSVNVPKYWLLWRDGKEVAKPLVAERILENRSKSEQLPQDQEGIAKLQLIYDHFKGDSYAFEPCAARLVQLLDKNISQVDVTRKSRDGGRDALGLYKIGLPENSITVDFALEAKCYRRDNSVGVRETSRLISRLRHRQFGFMVTTSYVNDQAYKEIIEDEHPVIIISGIDIIRILSQAGMNSRQTIKGWLDKLA